MAPVIWGLDLKEMQWYKFGSGYMFGNKDYYFRRTKFVVYQLVIIFCVVSQSLGTRVLNDYVDSQNYLRDRTGGQAVEHNDDYVGMASYNIFVGIVVAFIFGSAFFFDLFWPERHEDRGVRMAWKGCSAMACVFMLVSIILEVVIVSKRSAYVTGVSPEVSRDLLREFGGYNLAYNKNGRAIAAAVFAWLGFLFVIYSTVIMWMSIDHTEKHGPFSAHTIAQRKSAAVANTGGSTDDVNQKLDGAGSGSIVQNGGEKHELNDLEQGRPTTAAIQQPQPAYSSAPMQSTLGNVSGNETYPGT